MALLMETSVEPLNALLRGELSAIESYEFALTMFDGLPQKGTLRHLCDQHRQAAELLRQHIIDQDGWPAVSSGPWGYFAAAVTGTARLIGRRSTLAALRRGEEHGRDAFEDVLAEDTVDEECRDLIAGFLLPKSQLHMEVLDRLIAMAA